MDRWKSVYAQQTDKRTLGEVIDGADIFLGLSAPGVLKPDMVKRMAPQPLIMALANPTPEISPEEAVAARPDALICTGRSDYPNQVNNVLCFPYIFRGALDVGATTINEEMKRAAVEAIAALAREAPSEVAARAYGGEARTFGKGSLIPNPFDPRLILRIAPAVARAAIASGVATRPITDFATYEERLNRFVFRSGFIMKPVFAQAKAALKRVIYAEGEDERILRATQVVVEEGLARAAADRPAGDHRDAARALRPLDPARPRLRTDQSGRRPALPRLRAGADRGGGPQGRHARRGAHAGAHQRHRDRGARPQAGARRRHDLRRGGPLHGPPDPYPRHHRARAGQRHFRSPDHGDHRQGRLFSRRHPYQPGSRRRRNRRNGDPGRRACAPLRGRAEDRAALALGFRLLRVRVGPQDARGARASSAGRRPTSRSTAR